VGIEEDSSICSQLRDPWLISQLKLNRIVVQKWVLVKLIISKRVFSELCFITCMGKRKLHPK
jgi:hypothetical protein